MPPRKKPPPRGAIVWGMMKWIPFLALPFSVFFLEVRWQHEIFANDYETNQLSKDLRDLDRSIAELEGEEARLKTMALMETMAMELDLVEPVPRQIETIHVPATEEDSRSTFPPAPVAGEDPRPLSPTAPVAGEDPKPLSPTGPATEEETRTPFATVSGGEGDGRNLEEPATAGTGFIDEGAPEP